MEPSFLLESEFYKPFFKLVIPPPKYFSSLNGLSVCCLSSRLKLEMDEFSNLSKYYSEPGSLLDGKKLASDFESFELDLERLIVFQEMIAV